MLYAGPVFFDRVARVCREPLPSVRSALSTTAPLPAEVAARFEEATGVLLGQAYGVIEAGLVCVNTRGGGASAASVGVPTPGYEVTLRDDGGAPCRGEMPGEVWVRGPGLFSGYYAPWCSRDAALVDGWFRTGDVGVCDDAGRLTLLGRSKSTIIVAGMKVFPEEVEAVLDGLPGVAESRVFGHPHPRLGEIPIAEVVAASGARLDPRAMTAACATVLSSYKVPVEIRVVPAIAKTSSGKRLRHAPVTSRG
jgi:long-chain acyl-CoA synthetase